MDGLLHTCSQLEIGVHSGSTVWVLWETPIASIVWGGECNSIDPNSGRDGRSNPLEAEAVKPAQHPAVLKLMFSHTVGLDLGSCSDQAADGTDRLNVWRHLRRLDDLDSLPLLQL